jgi:general stress protein YciG
MIFFRKTGSLGGKARAQNHSKKQLSEWGKKGGRPKRAGAENARKGGK